LELALHLPHEHIVYQHIVIPRGQLVLNAHQLEFLLHLLRVIQLLQHIHHVDEIPFAALQLRSQQVTNPKNY
jgi:hypothetical protein